MSEEITIEDVKLRTVTTENIIEPSDHNNLREALIKVYKKYTENVGSFIKHPEIPNETESIRTVKTGDYIYAEDEQSIINILRKWDQEIRQRPYPKDKIAEFEKYLWRIPNVYAGSIILDTVHNNKVYAVKHLYDIVSTKLFLAGYKYRRKIVIKNNTNIDLYNYQVLIYLDGDIPEDYDTIEKIRFERIEEMIGGTGLVAVQDVRFTKEDGLTELPYWVEDWNRSGATEQRFGRIWVKIPHIPANSEVTIYMYYGNPEAESTSNGNEVWDFFDDFHSINPSIWSVDSEVVDYSIRTRDELLHPLIIGDVFDKYFLSIRDVDAVWGEKKGFHLIGYSIPQNMFRVGAINFGWDNQRSSNIFRWGLQISNTENWDREIDLYIYDNWVAYVRTYSHINIGATSKESSEAQNAFFPSIYFVKDQDNTARIITRPNGDVNVLLEELTTVHLSELLLLLNRYSLGDFANEVYVNTLFIGKYVYPEPSVMKYSEEKL